MLNSRKENYKNIVYAINAIENVIKSIESGISDIKEKSEAEGLNDLRLTMSYSELSKPCMYRGLDYLKGISNKIEFVIKNEELYSDKDISIEDVISFNDMVGYKTRFNSLINKVEKNAKTYMEMASNEEYSFKYNSLKANKKEVEFFLNNINEIIQAIRVIEKEYVIL